MLIDNCSAAPLRSYRMRVGLGPLDATLSTTVQTGISRVFQ
jgi:hypothetical protein